MKDAVIREVLQQMLPYMDNEQAIRLQSILGKVLTKYEFTETVKASATESTNEQMVTKFIEAKRIEGCSEKTLAYYRKTIDTMFEEVGKEVMHVVTEDLRSYLTKYQESKQLSRVTVDNVRRILSSFFSWLEDEDYILKSPVRRIHKVKTATNIKDTYTDEVLETMRDNCEELRDLAMIDMLASTGMPIEQLQQILGHKRIDTTLHYAMVKQSNVKTAHRKFIG